MDIKIVVRILYVMFMHQLFNFYTLQHIERGAIAYIGAIDNIRIGATEGSYTGPIDILHIGAIESIYG